MQIIFMFFDDKAKDIAAKIKSHNGNIVHDIRSIHYNSATTTRTEVQYFKSYFDAFEKYINNIRIPGINFKCRTKEIHGKPIVEYVPKQRCELGDYVVIIKYTNFGNVIGRKMIICQHKRTHNSSWSINQKQLMLLRDWPTFTFGKKATGYNTFTLKPSRPEFGCFVLINDPNKTSTRISNLYGNAYELSTIQSASKINVSDAGKFYYDSQDALFLLLSWEIGEPIVPDTQLETFTSTLYRYLEWEEDPPNEFDEFHEPSEEGRFWGIEITVTLGDTRG